MKEGSGIVNFEKQYPDRFYDVAIGATCSDIWCRFS